MKLGLAEIIIKASTAPNHRARVEVLQKNDSQALRRIFQLAYEEEWDFPPGWKPEYKPSPYFDQQGALYQSLRNIGKFLVGGYPGLTPERKKVLFVQLLESLDKDDAALLVGVKDGKIPWKGLGRATVREALPGTLREETPE